MAGEEAINSHRKNERNQIRLCYRSPAWKRGKSNESPEPGTAAVGFFLFQPRTAALGVRMVAWIGILNREWHIH